VLNHIIISLQTKWLEHTLYAVGSQEFCSGGASHWRLQSSKFIAVLHKDHLNVTAQILVYYNRIWRQISSTIRRRTVEIDTKQQRKILASLFWGTWSLRPHSSFATGREHGQQVLNICCQAISEQVAQRNAPGNSRRVQSGELKTRSLARSILDGNYCTVEQKLSWPREANYLRLFRSIFSLTDYAPDQQPTRTTQGQSTRMQSICRPL